MDGSGGPECLIFYGGKEDWARGGGGEVGLLPYFDIIFTQGFPRWGNPYHRLKVL